MTLGLLPPDGPERLHAAALALLEEVGVRIAAPPAVKVLAAAGARVDGDRVRMPRNLVEQALAAAPPHVPLHDREGGRVAVLGEPGTWFNPGSCATRWLESDGRTVRESTASDLETLLALNDTLEHIALQSTALVCHDVPRQVGDSYRLWVALATSPKPVVTGAFSAEGLHDLLDLLAAVAGSRDALAARPLAVFDACPSPPLKWAHPAAMNILEGARAGVPLNFISMPMPGAASPVTLAGSLLLHTVENLSGLVLAQVAQPGARVIWGGAPVVFDMRYGTSAMAAMEATLMGLAAAEMGRWYRLPTHTYAALSDGKVVDAQAGAETAAGAVLTVLGGINLVSGPGMLEFALTHSLEKLVIDHEICGQALGLTRGLRLDPEALASELIAELGPGGNYLACSHTRRHFRSEFRLPGPVLDRRDRRTWHAEGARDSWQQAREEAASRLARPPRRLQGPRREALDAAMREVFRRRQVSPPPHFLAHLRPDR